MNIHLADIGKRFGRHWLFRGLDLKVAQGKRIGIIGINGSGKSTLLQIIAGISIPTEGKVHYRSGDGSRINFDQLPGKLCLISPYMDLPEQLKLKEIFEFQQKFLAFKEGMNLKQFQKITLLEGRENTLIKQFSSGMKQRLKLGLAFYSQCELLLLDEPCSNLDQAGKVLYQKLLKEEGENRSCLIASNEPETELLDCHQTINLMDYK